MKQKRFIKPGMRFGRLTVMEFDRREINGSGDSYYYWRCRCDCGTECVINRNGLVNGDTRSCGCLRREVMRARRLGLNVGEREEK